MNRTWYLLPLLIAFTSQGFAQTSSQKFVIRDGKMVNSGGTAKGGAASLPKGGVHIGDSQKLMFAASKKIVERDYRSAEAIYTQVIASNNGNTDAYLQRALVRRELKDTQGMAADAKAAIVLASHTLKNNPNKASAWYQRSLGLRFLKQFDQARADLNKAIALKGRAEWQTDLKAIELEQKMAR